MSTIITTWSQGKMSKRRVGRQLFIVDSSQIGTMYEQLLPHPTTQGILGHIKSGLLYLRTCVLMGKNKYSNFLSVNPIF